MRRMALWLWRRVHRRLARAGLPPSGLCLFIAAVWGDCTESGFGDIAIDPHTQTVEMFAGVDVRTAAENFARINPIIAAFVNEAGEGKAEPLIDGLAEALAAYHEDNALRFPSATWLVSARA